LLDLLLDAILALVAVLLTIISMTCTQPLSRRYLSLEARKYEKGG